MKLISHLLAHLIFRLDSTRPALAQIVPNLDELRGNPASVFAKQTIAIAAAARIGTVMLALLVFFIVSAFLSCGLAAWVTSIPTIENWPRPYPGIVFLGIIGLVMPLLLGGTSIPMLLWMQGRSVSLGRDGVEFSDIGQTVRCPWALFREGGNTLQLAGGPALIPIATDAVGQVQLRRRGHTVAVGSEVHTGFFRFSEQDQLILGNCFRVQAVEIGELLLHVGPAMNKSQNQEPLFSPATERLQG